MIRLIQQPLVVAGIAWVLFWGCHSSTPKADPMPAKRAQQLLTQLMSVNEFERFNAQDAAIRHLAAIRLEDIESALTALRPKNVSTLLYVCIKTQSRLLYHLSPPAKMVIHNASGAFPNIAYYYARVRSASSMHELSNLYHANPDRRLPVCQAFGELGQPGAVDFLLTEATQIKSGGGSVTAHLIGLKEASDSVEPSDVMGFLEQPLDREEVIALAQVNVRWTDQQLESFWRSGAIKRRFALECILSDPETYFDSLRKIVAHYLDSGNTEMVRQLLLSDSMQTVSSQRLRQYRDEILAKIKTFIKKNEHEHRRLK